MTPYAETEMFRLFHGNSLDVLPTLADASVDSVVTDPPYELGFMGKAWDGSGVAYDLTLWREVLRVLKPGGHLLAFGGTRTYHRMAVAIEDAGFEIRDSIHWVYGSGFPKSLNVSKALDVAAGVEREVLSSVFRGERAGTSAGIKGTPVPRTDTITAPVTDLARQWEGWGTALKPAHEPIVMARKPLIGTVAANVVEYGTGALNIDGCRVGNDQIKINTFDNGAKPFGNAIGEPFTSRVSIGRWPANLVFTHAAECKQVGVNQDTFGGGTKATSGFVDGYEHDGFVGQTIAVPVWQCVPGCPVAALNEQSGKVGGSAPASGPTHRGESKSGSRAGAFKGNGDTPTPFYNDQGGASRFFTVTEWDRLADELPFRYVAKPGKKERNAGLDGLPAKQTASEYRPHDDGTNGLSSRRHGATTPRANHHPTVKPVALMRYLVRLVTPPGGTVLDPFAGSGTTLVAAIMERFNSIGIELTEDYLPIIIGRTANAYPEMTLDIESN